MLDLTLASKEAEQLRDEGRELLRHSDEHAAAAAWESVFERLNVLVRALEREQERLREQEPTPGSVYEQLRDYRLRYQTQFLFATDAQVVTDRQGIIQVANLAAGELFGLQPAFLVDKPLGLIIAEEFRVDFYQRLLGLMRGRERIINWAARVRSNGERIHVAVSAAFEPDGENADNRLVWLFRDVSKQRKAEETLLAERSIAAGVFNAAPAIILVLDPDGCVLQLNNYLQSIAGLTRLNVQNQAWESLLAPSDRSVARDMLARVLQERKRQRSVARLCTSDGTLRIVAWSAEPLPGNEHEQPSVLVVGQDITELQQAQEQKLQAERLAAIGQVTASLAHEGRNALQRAVASLARLQWRLPDDSEAHDLSNRVRKALSDLTRLFDEVKGYSGPLVLDRSPCLLPEVWQEAWQHVRAAAPDKPAMLTAHSTEFNLWCSVDRHRLGQVFRNVFENALNNAGEVVVEIAVQASTVDGRTGLLVKVSDNGPGLSVEQQQRIFEPFYTTRPEGTGLGMAIARRIVEAHGGAISAVNGAKQGAEIVVFLPRSEQ